MKLHFFTAIFVLLLTLLTSAYSATNHSRTTAVNGTSTTLRPVDHLTSSKNETTSSASWDHPTQFNHFKDSLECCQPIERRDLSYADTHLQRLNYNFMQNSMDFDSTFFYFNAQIGILNEITKRGQEDIIAPSKQPLLSLSQLHSLMYAFKTKISACASTSPARSAGDNLAIMSFNDDSNRFNSEFLQLYKKINDGIVVEDVRTFITGVIDELLFLLGKMIKNCFGKYMIESVNDNSQGLITLNNICIPFDSRLTEYEEGLFAKIYPQMKDEIIEVIKETVATNTETNMRGVIDANEIVKEALKRDYKVITLELLKNANDETIRTIKGLLEKEQSVKENPME